LTELIFLGGKRGLGELFSVPPEVKLEYVVATIDVKEQKLRLFLDKTQVDEFDYKMR
jgi:putative transposase